MQDYGKLHKNKGLTGGLVQILPITVRQSIEIRKVQRWNKFSKYSHMKDYVQYGEQCICGPASDLYNKVYIFKPAELQ